VKDVDGKEIVVDGGWNAEINQNQFSSTITKIHEIRGEKGSYSKKCLECWDIDLSTNGATLGISYLTKGCRSHRGNPLLFQSGDPTESKVFNNAKNWLKSKQRDHIIAGATPITPFQLLKIRKRLLSSNCVADLQMYVLILISINLFLRSNEATGEIEDPETKKMIYTGLSVSSIVSELCVVNDGVVEAIALKVMGKTDKKYHTLTLWRNHENTQFCPVAHLLIYIYVIDLRKGPLFPSSEELKQKPIDGVYKTYLIYSTFKNRFCELCNNLFGYDKWGTHTLRKSGYLFALWGGGTVELIMISARHSDILSAQKYVGDSLSQLEYAKRNGLTIAGLVSRWVPIYAKHINQNLGLNRNVLGDSVFNAAKYFVETLCNCDPKSKQFSILYIIENYENFDSKKPPMEAFNDFCAENNIKYEAKSKLLSIIGSMNKRAIYDVDVTPSKKNPILAQAPTGLSTFVQDNNLKIEPSNNKKRNRAQGTIDLEERKNMQKLNSKDRLKLILELEKAVPRNQAGEYIKTELTLPAQNFFHRSIVPVISCLEKCFKFDDEEFLKKYPTMAYSTFKCKC
jgi:hypothetical protein